MSDPIEPRKRKLKVDMEELGMAFEDASVEVGYFLDTETGQVARITHETRARLEDLCEDLDEGLEGEQWTAALKQAFDESGWPGWEWDLLLEADQMQSGFGDRFIRVPQADSHERYGDMGDFIDTVRDERLRELLEVAINGRGAFRRFKDVLTRAPKERERWFKFKDDRLRERIVEWLEEEGIEPIL